MIPDDALVWLWPLGILAAITLFAGTALVMNRK